MSKGQLPSPLVLKKRLEVHPKNQVLTFEALLPAQKVTNVIL